LVLAQDNLSGYIIFVIVYLSMKNKYIFPFPNLPH